jgi:hypothetical protein
MALRSHQENASVRVGPDERIRDLEPRQKSRALHPHVERVGRLEPELSREQAAVARKVVIGRHRREHDEVDVSGFEAGIVERAPGGFDSEVGRRRSAPRVPSLADSGALADPLVARVHQERHPLVGDDAFRNEHPGASDDRGGSRHQADFMRG